MHGEYKTPGGKLVVVDFNVEQGRLRNVVVTGDFFLYPEETLDTINQTLEDAPADLAGEELIARLEAAIPADAELVGFSPAAVVTAVQRGLE